MSDVHGTDIGHEKRDVRFPPVLVAVGLIIAMVLLAVVGMIGLFDVLAEREARRSDPANPLAQSVSKLPPEPRLQALPVLDLEALRAAEARMLDGYSWVDEQAGVARIPIERAMEVLVERRGGTAAGGKAGR